MKQSVSITINNENYIYIKPYYLLKDGCIKLRKAFVIGSSLYWKVNGVLVSYNQLKNKVKCKTT